MPTQALWLQKLGPSDQAQLVSLHQAWVGGNDADAETVGAAFSSRNASLVDVISVAIGLAALIEHSGCRIVEVAVVHFAVIGFYADVLRIDCAQMNARADLQGFADRNA